jgi:uncharacterized protein YukE
VEVTTVSGFKADHEQLAATGAKAGDKAKQAEGIQQKLDSANGLVPEKAWGLLGNMTVHHAYNGVLSTLQDHVSNMIKGVQKLADDIKDTADHYRQSDEAVEEKLKDLEKEMG